MQDISQLLEKLDNEYKETAALLILKMKTKIDRLSEIQAQEPSDYAIR